MAASNRHWWLLIVLVIASAAALLAADHLGLPLPEIQENRVLAKLPATPQAFGELTAYREGMDAYVADNFPARARLISALNFLRYRFGYSGTSRVVVGREGWLFYDDGGHLRQLRHGDPLAAPDAQAWASTLHARAASLQAQGIRYLVLVPPLKERVYPELAPRWALPHGGESDLEILSAASSRAGAAPNLLYLRDTMLRQRRIEPDVYTAYDTHWTGKGAYAGYVALLQRFAELGAPLQPLPRSALQTRRRPQLQQPQDLAYMLGIAAFVHQRFPEFENPDVEARVSVRYLTAQQDWTGDRVIDTGFPGPVLQWTGDSFSNELLPFLYPHFSRIVASHHEHGFYRPDLTDAYHPDIVVLEVLEGGARHSMAPAMSPPATAPAPLPPLRASAVAPVAVPTAMPSGLIAGAAPPVEGPAATYTHRCNLEEIGVGKDGRLLASGWMADVDGNRAGDAITLILQSGANSFRLGGRISIERPDVGAYFGKPALAHSGFQLDADALALPRGEYAAFLLQRYGEHELVCATGKTLAVAPAGQGGK